MNRYFAFVILCVVAACLAALSGGCRSAQKDAASANTKVHQQTAAVVANVTEARQLIARGDAKVQVLTADPATPKPITVTLSSAHADFVAADKPLAVVVSDNVPEIQKQADAQKAASDRAIADATDAQRKADERTGALIVGAAVALLVFLAFERFTLFGFGPAAIVGGIAGVLAFVLFGYVLAVVVPIVKFAVYAGLIAGGVALVLWGVQAWKQGGWAAIHADLAKVESGVALAAGNVESLAQKATAPKGGT